MSLWHHVKAVRSGDQLTFGERAADKMRNGFGSWTFVGLFAIALAIWMTLNSYLVWGRHGHKPIDPFPWILENLVLSMLAGIQAALLLIAAKRSDAIASEVALHTEKTTDEVKELLIRNTQLTEAVQDLTKAVHDHILGDKP